MSVFGISAFVDGLFKGREYRQEQDDKKYQRERQQRMDAITMAQEQRAMEEHQLALRERGIRLDTAGLELSEARRAAENEAAYRQLTNDLMAGGGASPAPAGAVVPPPSVSPAAAAPAAGGGLGAVTVSTKGPPPAQLPPGPARTASPAPVAGGLGLELTMQDAARARQQPIPAGLGAVASGRTSTAPVQQADPRGSVVSVRGMDEDVFLHPNGQAYGMSTGQRITDPQMLSIIRQQAAPSAQAQTQAPQQNPLAPNYNHDWGNNLNADLSEATNRVGAAGDALTEATLGLPVMAGATAANMVNRPLNVLLEAVGAPVSVPLSERGFFGPDAEASPAAVASGAPAPASPEPARGAAPALGPRKANSTAAPAPAAGMEQEVQAAATVGGPAAAVAVEAAQKVAGEPLGAPGAGQMSQQQVQRASTDALDHYTNVVAPRLIEEMVKRGDVDRALKYQDFIDQAATKAAMKDWSAAMVAAVDGNMDVFADKIITVYNRLDYYGDDTTIVKEKSGFTKDAQGNINGAKLTFRDEKTGNTWEQILDDPDQFITMGIAATAPERAFEHYEAKINAAREGARGAAKENQQRLDDLAKLIFTETNKGALSEDQKITYADAMLQAQEQLDAARAPAAPGAAPDLLRRP